LGRSEGCLGAAGRLSRVTGRLSWSAASWSAGCRGRRSAVL